MKDFFILISDHGNAIVSKLITYFGLYVGIGGGTVQVIAANTIDNKIVQACANAAPSWLAYVPAIAAITLSIKHITDMYFKFKDRQGKE